MGKWIRTHGHTWADVGIRGHRSRVCPIQVVEGTTVILEKSAKNCFSRNNLTVLYPYRNRLETYGKWFVLFS